MGDARCLLELPAILNPGQRLHTSSHQQVVGMQLCSSDVVFNFLLIAKMQQHDSAREPGLQSGIAI
jgi:hypothetical protein